MEMIFATDLWFGSIFFATSDPAFMNNVCPQVQWTSAFKN